MTQEQSLQQLSFRDKLASDSQSFIDEAKLALDSKDFKKKLELLARGCYLVAGIETLIGMKRMNSALVHLKTTGKISPEVETCLQELQQGLLSSGKH